MSDREEFTGIGHVYLRPGQWVAVHSAGDVIAGDVTVKLNEDGTMTAVAHHHHNGGAGDSVTFTPQGKVKA